MISPPSYFAASRFVEARNSSDGARPVFGRYCRSPTMHPKPRSALPRRHAPALQKPLILPISTRQGEKFFLSPIAGPASRNITNHFSNLRGTSLLGNGSENATMKPEVLCVGTSKGEKREEEVADREFTCADPAGPAGGRHRRPGNRHDPTQGPSVLRLNGHRQVIS
jgi:hypothetical protein